MASTTTTTTATAAFECFDLFHQTLKILNANSLHFFTISLLFLPLTFSITTAIHAYVLNDFQNLFTLKTLTVLIVTIISTVIGEALTTYSTHQAICREPVTFTSTIKSLSRSFIPLLTTFLAGLIKLTFIAILISLLGLGLGFGLLYDDLIIWQCLVVVLCYYMMIWHLAPAIAVLESRSGFEALRQSKNQSTMVQLEYYSTFHGQLIGLGLVMVIHNGFVHNMESVSKYSIVLVGLNYIFVLFLFVEYAAMNTVFYVRCNALDSSVGEEVYVSGSEAMHGGFGYVTFGMLLVWIIILLTMALGYEY